MQYLDVEASIWSVLNLDPIPIVKYSQMGWPNNSTKGFIWLKEKFMQFYNNKYTFNNIYCL